MAEAAVKSEMFVWEGKDKSGKTVKNEMSGASEQSNGRFLSKQRWESRHPNFASCCRVLAGNPTFLGYVGAIA